MNAEDPSVAQQIVAAYAGVLERCVEAGELPAATSALPYGRDLIKIAIRTSVAVLQSDGKLTPDLREFLQEAYVGLADFVDDELARLMSDFNRAAKDARPGQITTSERMQSDSWKTLERTSPLAAKIAQSIASDAERLRAEFQSLIPAQ
jgi:hypothetical protein